MASTRLPGSANENADARTVSLLAGLCFFLSLIEYMIPKPLPFIRLGLANVPLLLALDILPFPAFALLCGLKIFGQALLSGTLFSYAFLFSLGGTAAAAFLMYGLRNVFGKERISLIGVSAAGALASNAVTLLLAYYFVFGASVRYAAAPVLAFGIVTGTLLGICAEYFIARSRWYAGAVAGTDAVLSGARGVGLPPENNFHGSTEDKLRVSEYRDENGFINRLENFRKIREVFFLKTFHPGELALAGLCVIPALLLNQNTYTRIIQFLFFYFLAWLSGKKNNPLATFSVMAGIIFFNLLVPYGEVLFELGPFRITSGALLGGIRRAVTLEGLFMLSRCFVRSGLALPERKRRFPDMRARAFFRRITGRAGEIAGESFRIFSGMTEEKISFGKKWAERLDELLISFGGEMTRGTDNTQSSFTAAPSPAAYPHPQAAPPCGIPQKQGGTFLPRIILVAAVILAWLPLAAS